MVGSSAQETTTKDPEGDTGVASLCFPWDTSKCVSIVLESVSQNALNITKPHAWESHHKKGP